MPSAYVRHSARQPLTYSASADSELNLLVFDAVGETGADLLDTRLQRLPPLLRQPDVVVFRGLADLHRETIADASLQEYFPPHCRIYDIVSVADEIVNSVGGSSELATPERRGLLMRIRDLELSAILHWSEGIWNPAEFHFVLPSGEHADKFIRIGDALGDWLNVSRIADWLEPAVTPHVAVVADTGTLLPLMQELRNRVLHRHPGGAVLMRTFPSYHPTREELDEQISEALVWAGEGGDSGKIIFLLSVNASGGLRRRIETSLDRLSVGQTSEIIILAEANDPPDPRSLSCFPSRRFASTEDCELCANNSPAVEIDQQRFTTRIFTGTKTLSLPKGKEIRERTRMVVELNSVQALWVHSNRPNHHKHLGIYIDPQAALRNEAFRAAADAAFDRTLSLGRFDLVLVPRHENSAALEQWVRQKGFDRIRLVSRSRPDDSEVELLIQQAKLILIVDDAILSGHTMRSVLQYVQQLKGARQDEDYEVLGLALIGRTPDSDSWRGVQECFFIKGRFRLETAFQTLIPEWGSNCPWCLELRALEDLAQHLTDGRDYLEMRLDRLRDPNGLQENLFIGAELAPPDPRDESRHTTPHSFWGNLTDVGAFVAASSEFQKVRDAWHQKADALVYRYVLPTAQILRRYRDPVLAAAMLRAANARELWSAEKSAQIMGALRDSIHFRHHSVLAAELLWAGQRQKLPPEIVTHALNDREATLPPDVLKIIRALLE
jgi:hypothetical protein